MSKCSRHASDGLLPRGHVAKQQPISLDAWASSFNLLKFHKHSASVSSQHAKKIDVFSRHSTAQQTMEGRRNEQHVAVTTRLMWTRWLHPGEPSRQLYQGVRTTNGSSATKNDRDDCIRVHGVSTVSATMPCGRGKAKAASRLSTK